MKRIVLLTIVIVMLLYGASRAEERWVIGISTTGHSGSLRLEAERELPEGRSVYVVVGREVHGEVRVVLGAFRLYFSEHGSRGFMQVSAGTVVTPEKWPDGGRALPYLGITGGFEMRLSRRWRITVEREVCLTPDLPFPVERLSIGYVF